MLAQPLTQAGLTARLNDQGGLSVEGLGALPGPQAEALRRYIRENKAQLVNELCSSGCEPEGKESQNLENIGKDQAESEKASKKANINGGNPCAALELIDLERNGRIVLDAQGRPGPPPGHVWTEGDQGFVDEIWREAMGG